MLKKKFWVFSIFFYSEKTALDRSLTRFWAQKKPRQMEYRGKREPRYRRSACILLLRLQKLQKSKSVEQTRQQINSQNRLDKLAVKKKFKCPQYTTYFLKSHHIYSISQFFVVNFSYIFNGQSMQLSLSRRRSSLAVRLKYKLSKSLCTTTRIYTYAIF